MRCRQRQQKVYATEQLVLLKEQEQLLQAAA